MPTGVSERARLRKTAFVIVGQLMHTFVHSGVVVMRNVQHARVVAK
jgi:hypothetical protein